MKSPRVLLAMLLLLVGSCQTTENEKKAAKNSPEASGSDSAQKPNIVLIYADDLGYGDVSAYGAEAVSTPNIDSLARNGIRFTDAHCAAATCTPSRYALLTGTNAFRNDAQVLPGDAPMLIEPGSPTLPAMLQEAGYATGVVGKWHLGLGKGKVNWNKPVKPGPLEIGFDYSFLIPATGDRVPCAFLENHQVVGLEDDDPLKISFTDDPSGGNPFGGPTGLSHPERLKQPADTQHSGSIINGASRIGFQTGGKNAEWVDEQFPFVLTDKAKSFIDQNQSKPFFLYFSFHDIHVPRLPNKKFQGATDMGPRGDAIVQMDWVTGQILDYLKAKGLSENTLVLFSSDNGPVLNDGYEDSAVEKLGDHKPWGPYRGGKYSAYEAGTRVPTVAYWPGQIDPQVSQATWSQVDLYRSIADLVGQKLPEKAAPDSKNMLPALLGRSKQGRQVMLEESFAQALRYNQWKYIAPTENEYPWIGKKKNIESGLSPKPQLYNLAQDPEEQNNLAAEKPELVNTLQTKLDSINQAPQP